MYHQSNLQHMNIRNRLQYRPTNMIFKKTILFGNYLNTLSSILTWLIQTGIRSYNLIGNPESTLSDTTI